MVVGCKAERDMRSTRAVLAVSHCLPFPKEHAAPAFTSHNCAVSLQVTPVPSRGAFMSQHGMTSAALALLLATSAAPAQFSTGYYGGGDYRLLYSYYP